MSRMKKTQVLPNILEGMSMRIKTMLRIVIFLICAALICVVVCGCENTEVQTAGIVEVTRLDDTEDTRTNHPVNKKDGSKFKLAYVDEYPYNELFRMLYYLIECLKADGWITYDRLPFDPDTDSDTVKLMNWLADHAQSEYMEFDKTVHFYTSTSTKEEIYGTLKQHIEIDGDIDAILTMGTVPSQMVKELNFDIPVLMYGVSDPVASGLVKSETKSGDWRYWAHVDSSGYSRQMKYYYDMFHFKNIGSVYVDEIVCALPDYCSVAEENGFKITKVKLETDFSEDEDKYYEELLRIYRKMIYEDGIDAYIINTDIIHDAERAPEIMQIFLDVKIPVFVQEGTVYVKNGSALLIMDPGDAEGTAPFAAYVIGSVFKGTKSGDLEQVYISSPCITFNLDVAELIGYSPSFRTLLACDEIISRSNGTPALLE